MKFEKSTSNNEGSTLYAASHTNTNGLSIQQKLSIGAVNDPLEYEADAMADKVMRMPEQNFIQRKCAHCEEEERAQRKPSESFLQKKETADNQIASDTVSNQIQSTKGSGNVMPDTTKSFMESRFGANFSNVKIHIGSYASQLSNQLNAQAFTVGNDIYFNEGKYQPESSEGKHLLAHELTHMLQQDSQIKRQPAAPKNSKRFKHHNVNVVIRSSCDDAGFGLNVVEDAFKRALDKIFSSTCIEASRRKAIQANLVKNGYDVRCLDSAKLENKGACAESTGFSIPANILTLGSKAFAGGSCGDLASTILHEIIHVTRGRFEEDVSSSCEASCFGFGSASPDLCKNTDVFGKKHP
ncbi:MAG: eCIS core domain-containing protein [Ginsengibacter sp.]